MHLEMMEFLYRVMEERKLERKEEMKTQSKKRAR